MNSAAWVENIKGHAKRASKLLVHYYRVLPYSADPSRRAEYQNVVDELHRTIGQLEGMFADDQIPQDVRELRTVFTTARADPSNHLNLLHLGSFINRLHHLGEVEDSVPSYLKFIEGFGDDQELQATVDALLEKLETIATTCDDVIAAKLMTDLKKIIDSIKLVRRDRFVDLTRWFDYAGMFCATLVDYYTQTPVALLAYEAAKKAADGRVRIQALVDQANRDFTFQLSLPSVEARVKRLQSATPEPIEALQKKLLPPAKNSSNEVTL